MTRDEAIADPAAPIEADAQLIGAQLALAEAGAAGTEADAQRTGAQLALVEAEAPQSPPLSAFLRAVSALGAFLQPEERAGGPVPCVQGRWYAHTPALAEAGAVMLAEAPELFVGLDFGPADLLAEKDRLLALQAACAAVARLGEQLDRAVALRKDRLARRTGQLRDAVAAKSTDPALPRAVHERLRIVSAPLRALQDQRRQARRAALRRTLAHKALVQATDDLPPG